MKTSAKPVIAKQCLSPFSGMSMARGNRDTGSGRFSVASVVNVFSRSFPTSPPAWVPQVRVRSLDANLGSPQPPTDRPERGCPSLPRALYEVRSGIFALHTSPLLPLVKSLPRSPEPTIRSVIINCNSARAGAHAFEKAAPPAKLRASNLTSEEPQWRFRRPRKSGTTASS